MSREQCYTCVLVCVCLCFVCVRVCAVKLWHNEDHLDDKNEILFASNGVCGNSSDLSFERLEGLIAVVVSDSR